MRAVNNLLAGGMNKKNPVGDCEILSIEEMPMDFHIYEVQQGRARLELEIDYRWKIFGISYSGSKKEMKQFKRIARDLYLYYGVSKEDISNKTDRYHSLLATLSA